MLKSGFLTMRLIFLHFPFSAAVLSFPFSAAVGVVSFLKLKILWYLIMQIIATFLYMHVSGGYLGFEKIILLKSVLWGIASVIHFIADHI